MQCFTSGLEKLLNSTLLMARSNSSNIHATPCSFRLFFLARGTLKIMVAKPKKFVPTYSMKNLAKINF